MDKIFQKRHSVRSFQKKEVEAEKLKEILEAVNSAPSAGGLEAREVVVVQDETTKKKLAKAAAEQDFIAEASVVFVFFAVPKRSAQKYGQRGENLYSIQDATIAVSFAWLQAVSLGLAGCWVGALDEQKVKEILKISANWQPIAILPIGYAR